MAMGDDMASLHGSSGDVLCACVGTRMAHVQMMNLVTSALWRLR